MEFPQELLDKFVNHVNVTMDKRGVYPTPVMYRDLDDGLNVSALLSDMSPRQCLEYFWSIPCLAQGKAVIMGIDRFTQPGQGTEFRDVLTLFLWWDDPAITWYDSYKVGVINYQNKPRIVRPIDWDNAFWNKQLIHELRSTRPRYKISIERAKRNSDNSS
jgi:hypothetical protein